MCKANKNNNGIFHIDLLFRGSWYLVHLLEATGLQVIMQLPAVQVTKTSALSAYLMHEENLLLL